MNPGSAAARMPGQRSGLALASLILGLAGIFLCLGPLAGIPAIICGHKAHGQIRRSGGALEGLGLATAGLVTGYISLAMIFIMALLAAIAVPNFIRAREAAQRNACRSNMRMIEGAKEQWSVDEKKTPGAIPSDAELFGPDKYLGNRPTCPAGGTYLINANNLPPACSKHGTLNNDVRF
jgi:competence protein ComGC